MIRKLEARTEALGRPCKRCGADEWRVGKSVRCAPCHRGAQRRNMNRIMAGDPRLVLFSGARTRALAKGLDFLIKIDDIVIPAACPVLGRPMVRAKGRWSDDSPTIDRLDPRRGYTVDNIRVISYRANRLKSDGTAVEHEKIAAWQRKET
jgi:hypothetical protein